MIDDKVILWKPRRSDFKPDQYTPKELRGRVTAGELLGADLTKVIGYLKETGRAWDIARVVCSPKDIQPAPELGTNWYQAVRELPLEERFVALEEIEREYLPSCNMAAIHQN